jgi:hypothetical protein
MNGKDKHYEDVVVVARWLFRDRDDDYQDDVDGAS